MPPALGFIAGIAAARVAAPALVPLVALSACALLLVPWASQRGRFRLLIALAAAAGAAREGLETVPVVSHPREHHVIGRVGRSPEPLPDGAWRIVLDRAGPRSDLRYELLVRGGSNGERHVAELLRGDVVRAWVRSGRQTPGELRARSLDGRGTVKHPALIERIAPGRWGPGRTVDALRRHAREVLERRVAEPRRRRLVAAMLLGDARALDGDSRDALTSAGLAHVTAVSGLHVGLAVALLGGLALGRRTLRAAVVCVVLAIFAVALGDRPSVRRAVAAASVAGIGRGVGRDGDPLNSLAWIAAALLAAEPGLLVAPGFQLSFLATAAVLTTGGWRVPAAAYAATAPCVAWHFGRLAPIGILSNVIAIPLAAGIVGAGYLALLVERLCPALSAPLFEIARLAAAGLLALADVASALPIVAVPQPPWWFLAAYAALCWRVSVPGGPAIDALARGALGVALVLLHLGLPPPPPEAGGSVAVLDVGQGLSVAFRSGQGSVAVIDTGGVYGGGWDPGRRVVVPFLLRHSGRRVDVLALTHDDLDHVDGARAILDSLEVGELWIPPRAGPKSRRVIERAHARGVAVVLAERGLESGQFAVMAPHRDDEFDRTNDRSLVVRLGRAPNRVLVPGDIGRAGARTLLATSADLAAELLVLAHHGAEDGTEPRLLQRVDPHVAASSSGRDNRFGHPHPAVVRRLRNHGVPLMRTDRSGTIELVGTAHGWAPLSR